MKIHLKRFIPDRSTIVRIADWIKDRAGEPSTRIAFLWLIGASAGAQYDHAAGIASLAAGLVHVMLVSENK